MWIMDLKEEFDEAAKFVSKLTFDPVSYRSEKKSSTSQVEVFFRTNVNSQPSFSY